MLSYLLALAVALSSLALYLAAFFYPELHRKQDFLWSGVGLFYALILWLCAGQMTGALLLGQLASVSLIMALGWQTLWLRRQRTPQPLQTIVSTDSWQRLRQLFIEPFMTWSQRLGLSQWWQTVPWPSIASDTDDADDTDQEDLSPSAEAESRRPHPATRRATHYEFIDETRQPWPDVSPGAAPAVTTTAPGSGRGKTAAVTADKQQTRPVEASPPRPSPKKPAAAAATPTPETSPPSWLGRMVIVKDWVLEVAQGLLKPKRQTSHD
ncbi:hypothetical protein XM38_004690 [Halomicronema hongdechloris C2206]|uniref:Ycf66 family protein n=1 Tax=Halomicronema hongdechloris C2206 TaxID=1641165 RepID=A0A1Z3HGU0_9CYAN|nr:Ycf66 family protein [Halomicronema hongdechloris]ASC69542.1 hypothetical protein XM38_004690 [Halomicronema hongdechloris C2206]